LNDKLSVLSELLL